LLSNGFVQTALVSDMPGLAPHTDPALLNPWGFTVSTRGEFLISDNNGGNGALFAADGTALGAPIVMPPPAGSPAGSAGAPTGQVLNATADFVISEGGRSAPAAALFSTEDGTIIGFNSAVDPSNGILAADQSAGGAVYKGLAMGSAGGANYLYASNFRSGAVDVFDTHFALHTFFAGQFTDPNAPAGFAPFGIKNIHGILFVTYAKQNAEKHDDVEGPGNGFIDEFDTSGHFLKRFASGTAVGGTLTELNSPWGMAVAPHGFGKFGGDLLVGNFGDSHVNVFNLKTGRFLGQLEDTHGQPLVLDGGFHGPSSKGLWGIEFGNGEGGAGKHTLFFASGINDEADGVFGMVNLAGREHGDNGRRFGMVHMARRVGDPATAGAPSSSGAVKSLVFVPSPQINGLELLATAAIADNDIWAIGDVVTGPGAAQPVAEHFDGKKWSVVPTPAFNSDSFSGVAGVASNDVWAVGTLFGSSGSESTLIEHWNGTRWSVVPSPTPTNGGFFNAVTAIASNDVWAAGNVLDSTGAPVAALVEHWDGRSWKIVSSPAFAGVNIDAISGDAGNDVWAVGSAGIFAPAPFTGPAVLHWNGTRWSLINPNTGVSAAGVKALSPTNVWAVGQGPDTDFDSFFSRIEHWDGTSWSIVPSPRVNPPEPLDTHSFLSGIGAISAKDIWAVGGAVGKSLTEHWDGKSWSVIASPNPGSGNFLLAATALSDGTVAAVGFQSDFAGHTFGLILQDAKSAP
jgi:uncharacterized protein (TIGR03118 family)